MNKFIGVVLLVVGSWGVGTAALMNGRARQELQRRQAVSYSSSVIHQDPNHPDQAAESTVKVSFNTQPEVAAAAAKLPPPAFGYGHGRFFRPKTVPNFVATPTHEPSQLFNVGYSVRFTNAQTKDSRQFARPKVLQPDNDDGGDIITGTKKYNEEVERPNFDVSPEEFVSNALIDKKHKISGIKPKLHYAQAPPNYINPNVLLAQANLSPTTQRYYKALEELQTNVKEPQQRPAWRNLSPGVEIIKSTEIAVQKPHYRVDPQQFDHVRALERGQSFDYTNALGLDDVQKQNHVPALFYNNNNNNNNNKNLAVIQRTQPQQIGGQNPPHFPMDTSLLKEPILTTDLNGAISHDASLMPIHFDTRLLQEAMKTHFAYPAAQLYAPVLNGEPPLPDTNYVHYKGQPPGQNKPVPVVVQKQPDFQDYQTQPTQFQYNIYNKPQPVRGAGGGGGNQKSFVGDYPQRQPRFLPADYNLQTDLRPPPYTVNYQRRIYLG